MQQMNEGVGNSFKIDNPMIVAGNFLCQILYI